MVNLPKRHQEITDRILEYIKKTGKIKIDTTYIINNDWEMEMSRYTGDIEAITLLEDYEDYLSKLSKKSY